jgi:hypothetical protein
MANEMFTQLPTVTTAMLSDIICAVQGGVSVQETLGQIQQLFQSNVVLNFPGNPNGNLAGTTYQLCWDTTDKIMYVCTTSGDVVTAVWTAIAPSAGGVIPPSQGGTGIVNPTAHALPIAEGAGNFNFLGPLTNGQLLIGSTGADPVPANLMAGTNISIVNSAGGITISGTGFAGFSWNTVTGTTQAMLSNNGYIVNNAGLVTLTLPTTSAVGDEIDIIGKGTGGWLIAQNAGQTIVLGSSTTTAGVSGSLASTNHNDSFYMTCTVANTEWRVSSGPVGNITVV